MKLSALLRRSKRTTHADAHCLGLITVELSEEQLRAVLDVIGKRVSDTGENYTPLYMAERALDSALLHYEETGETDV